MTSDFEVVAIVGTDEEAALIAGFLDSQGIPALIESLLFHQEPVNFGRLGEVRIKVPGDRREEAERLLAERQAADATEETQAGEDEEPGEGEDEGPGAGDAGPAGATEEPTH